MHRQLTRRSRRFGHANQLAGRAPGALAAALGGTSVLLAASVLGLVLALAEKALCWSGAWNDYAKQFQRACYSDLYSLYGSEGLAAGQIPYFDHKVEYPVLTGAAMQAAAWLVRAAAIRCRPVRCISSTSRSSCWSSRPSSRWPSRTRPGRGEIAGRPCPGGAQPGAGAERVRQLGPARDELWLHSVWPPGRPGGEPFAGILLGLAIATKFYPVVFFWSAAAPVPAGRPDAGVLGHMRRRGGNVAGGQPAGGHSGPGRLGLVL